MSHGRGSKGSSRQGSSNFRTELAVNALRAAVLAITAAIVAITVDHCVQIYFDRHSALMDNFMCVSQTLTQARTPHWVTNGTLLGAVRLGHFVLWDSEIDLAMLLPDDWYSSASHRKIHDIESTRGGKKKSASDHPLVQSIVDNCAGLGKKAFPIEEEIEDGDRVVEHMPSSSKSSRTPTPGAWQLCGERVCVVLYEFIRSSSSSSDEGADNDDDDDDTVLLSPWGRHPLSSVLPLSSCNMSDLVTTCPHDAGYFLKSAFGENWVTTSLTTLFS